MTDPNRQKRWHAPCAASCAALLVALAACGDDPFDFNWDDSPDTAQLYSLARPESNLASGFGFAPPPGALIVEEPGATGLWDVALDTQNGQLVLLPPGALGITARAAVATIPGIAFDDVRQAPDDTLAYVRNDPVPLALGNVYVVSTNQRVCSFGASGVYYAKLEPVTIDVAGGLLTFRFVNNEICNSRELVRDD